MTNDELLTTVEAGALLGKSARTVQRLIASGDLTAERKLPGPNGSWLIRRSEVERVVAEALAAESAEAS